MGMDVYGEAPLSDKGEYFRNNVWWWRPLWNYIGGLGLLSGADLEQGHNNGGHLIPAAQSVEIADRLDAEVASGRCATYAAKYQASLDALPDEPCDLCSGTGKRTDMEVKDGCNKCHGKKTVRPFDTYYPFSVENVQEFALFANNSGGFRIR